MYTKDYDQKKAMQDFRVVLKLKGHALTGRDVDEYALAQSRLLALSTSELLDAVMTSIRSGVSQSNFSSTGHEFLVRPVTNDGVLRRTQAGGPHGSQWGRQLQK